MSAIYLSIVVGSVVAVLAIGKIVYGILSKQEFDASAEKLVSVDEKLKKILDNKIWLQNVFMGIEVTAPFY